MEHNNVVRAAGELWCRQGCIPMGGSFSTQAADLHSLWSVYTSRRLFYTLGQLCMSPEGFPFSRNAHGIVALCQFRDNIMIATNYPDYPSTHIVQTVCQILETAWNLAVLCDCRQQKTDLCCYMCHTSHYAALGFSLHRGATGQGTAHVQPSALDANWSLKPAPPLMTPTLHHPSYLPCICAGVLSNARPWCKSWGGELLSVAVWLQVAQLSGFSVRQTARAAHAAIVRTLSTSPHDHRITLKYMYYIVRHIPVSKCCAINMTLQWLTKNAHWRAAAYSSWTLPRPCHQMEPLARGIMTPPSCKTSKTTAGPRAMFALHTPHE